MWKLFDNSGHLSGIESLFQLCFARFYRARRTHNVNYSSCFLSVKTGGKIQYSCRLMAETTEKKRTIHSPWTVHTTN